jgi:hypothetical protein
MDARTMRTLSRAICKLVGVAERWREEGGGRKPSLTPGEIARGQHIVRSAMGKNRKNLVKKTRRELVKLFRPQFGLKREVGDRTIWNLVIEPAFPIRRRGKSAPKPRVQRWRRNTEPVPYVIATEDPRLHSTSLQDLIPALLHLPDADVAKELNKRRIRTPDGGRWNVQWVKYAQYRLHYIYRKNPGRPPRPKKRKLKARLAAEADLSAEKQN